jgi:hypothetical protein
MSALLGKLQYEGSEKIYVLGAPKELEPHLQDMARVTTVKSSPTCKQEYGFALFFVKSCADIAKYAPKAAQKVPDDGLLWFAYPKKSTKSYQTDISRDGGWQPLGDLGYEAVRQVAFDDDWSVLRFRRVEFIKQLRRDTSRAMSTKGKTRTGRARKG